ncbi:MAG TPA: hypothetical protein VI454_18500 [Verrucomicrobiae bacterium]
MELAAVGRRLTLQLDAQPDLNLAAIPQLKLSGERRSHFQIRIDMGILNRDYMKRSSDDDDDGRGSLSDSKVEAFLSGFLQRHPRFFIYVGIGLGVMVVAAIVVARLTVRSQ